MLCTGIGYGATRCSVFGSVRSGMVLSEIGYGATRVLVLRSGMLLRRSAAAASALAEEKALLEVRNQMPLPQTAYTLYQKWI